MKLLNYRNTESAIFVIMSILCGIFFHWIFFLFLIANPIAISMQLWQTFFDSNRPFSNRELIFAKQELSRYLQGRFVGTTRELIKLAVRNGESISLDSFQSEILNETPLGQEHIRRVASLLRENDSSFEKIESLVFKDFEFKIYTDNRRFYETRS